MVKKRTSIASALLVAATLMTPALAFAQDDAVTAPPAAPPSYSTPEETVSGRVVSFDGNTALQVRDDRGYVDNVQLRDGTVINPTGIRLAPGMRVTVSGVNRGAVLVANQIDTPYQSYGAPVAYPYPVVPYAYPVYAAPYAYGVPYGFGFPYGYGPSVSIGIGFGFGGWGRGRWH